VPILPTDDVDALSARVHQVEHECLIEAVARAVSTLTPKD
jgi:folate-dependent phosphoribosylglycinamide formyltransferase PurN